MQIIRLTNQPFCQSVKISGDFFVSEQKNENNEDEDKMRMDQPQQE